jgi:hypothetical protein
VREPPVTPAYQLRRAAAGHVLGAYLRPPRDLQTVARAFAGLALRVQPGQLPRKPLSRSLRPHWFARCGVNHAVRGAPRLSS